MLRAASTDSDCNRLLDKSRNTLLYVNIYLLLAIMICVCACMFLYYIYNVKKMPTGRHEQPGSLHKRSM